jgi:hypothetical protein
MLQIGWVDFSKEHRKRVLNVLSFLTQKGAVDELGIGVIRDRLADILFPGTSTIQTRAKYFFIVPWIMRDLEKQNLQPSLFEQKLAMAENKMIEVLKSAGGDGIIGEISGEKLKRKPAEIYWNGLRTYGIFRHQGLNIYKYIQVAGQLGNEKLTRKQLLRTEDGVQIDDRDAFGLSKLGPSWNIIEPPVNWQKELSINLSYDEASFLQERIITAPASRHSLWAALLRDFSKEVKDLKTFMELKPFVEEMAEQIQTDYKLALDFSRLINGAHIRYNLIFFRNANIEEKETFYKQQWQEWIKDMSIFEFSSWDTENFLQRLVVRQGGTREFIRKWVDFAKRANSADLQTLDNLIEKREIIIKGKERSKLLKAKEQSINTDYKAVGIIGYLQYRWPNAQRLLKDILEGLAG